MPLPAAFLAVPSPGDPALAALRRKVRLLAARGLLTAPTSGLPARMARSLPAVQRGLEASLRAHPDAVLDVVGSPDVLAGALCVYGGALGAAEVLPETIASLVAGLAARRALPESILWEAEIRQVVDGIGQRAAGPVRAVVGHGDRVEIELPDGARRELAEGGGPFHELAPGLHLSLVDTNPLSAWEEHPEKQGNAVSLGGREAGEWVLALREALDLVRIGLPSWSAELPVALSRLVPVGYEAERHLSASYREVPGLAYLTLHPDPVTLAEAIVHETQHGKLNLATWLDPVLTNGRTFWTSSPVRPDLRPLIGVLLAVHAFIPVAALHHGLIAADHPLSRTSRFAERREAVLAGNARGLGLVREHGEATALGKRVVDGLTGLHTALMEGVGALDPLALPPG